ncbi:post-PEP-CTERM-1 domain-containing protein [Rhizobacter sp. Root404]|jgi:hypothetical protein|uniref:post-PEP-CTERM-1 domain-containing protein n=1 Tax=Rhizobacter sp. Root404 TaxID=1736528 RepID=UPI000A9920CB|nr:hypothetical protein [Rhizobacter sp. Root404]
MTLAINPLALAGAALCLAAFATPAAMAGNDSIGMRVVRDPVTGVLRAPTHEEFKAMQDEEKAARAAARTPSTAAAEAAAAPVRIQGANGAKGVRAGDAFLSYSVVTRQADGSLDTACVTGAEAAEKIVLAKPTAATSAKASKKGHDHDHQ